MIGSGIYKVLSADIGLTTLGTVRSQAREYDLPNKENLISELDVTDEGLLKEALKKKQTRCYCKLRRYN